MLMGDLAIKVFITCMITWCILIYLRHSLQLRSPDDASHKLRFLAGVVINALTILTPLSAFAAVWLNEWM